MVSNDLKKGATGMLKNGWKFRIEDNMKGNTRLATVYGFATEIGSIYVHDIAYVNLPDGTTTKIDLTPAQVKCQQMVKAMGF